MMRISSAVPITPVSNGSCGCVRCPTMAVAVVDHLLRDVGVMIEPEDDRHVRAQDRAAERDLLALDVVDALGRAGAVQLQRQPVDRSGRRASPARILSSKKSNASRVMRPPATAQARTIGTVSIGEPGMPRHASRCPPTWPRSLQLVEDLRTFENAERLVVAQASSERD